MGLPTLFVVMRLKSVSLWCPLPLRSSPVKRRATAMASYFNRNHQFETLIWRAELRDAAWPEILAWRAELRDAAIALSFFLAT
jgi:hypothetical protein